MNTSSLNNSTNATTFTSPQSSSTAPGITAFTQITYSIIATIAFLGNMLVISMFCRDRKLLKKSYNMLILSLAIADVLTALLLITNPAFVLGDSFPYPTNHVLGNIFCRVVWNRVFLFQLVIFSAYICLALTIERWYAVIKPFRYSGIFNKKRTLAYILTAWPWSLVLCGSTFFEVAYVPSNAPNRRCKWQFFWGKQPLRAIVGIIQVLLKMALPSFTMLALYAHMLYKTSKSTAASAESKAKMRGKMTRMVGAACIMLIVCLAPSQTNYALAMAGKVKMDTKLHHGLSLLVFISSCLNPFIYGLSNRNYRVGFQKILCPKCNRVIQSTRKLMSRKIHSEIERSGESYIEEHRTEGNEDRYQVEQSQVIYLTGTIEGEAVIRTLVEPQG
ncbi:melatonin receptor type 1B-like [Oculina patagonica]